MSCGSSGEIAVAVATVKIVRIHIHVVVIRLVVIRRLIEETGARTVIGAVTARSDIVDAGIAREIAAGLVRTPRRATAAAAKTRGIAKAALMAAAHHATNAVHQKPAADHT